MTVPVLGFYDAVELTEMAEQIQQVIDREVLMERRHAESKSGLAPYLDQLHQYLCDAHLQIRGILVGHEKGEQNNDRETVTSSSSI